MTDCPATTAGRSVARCDCSESSPPRLIAPDRVLNAAHCLDGADPRSFEVVIGVDGGGAGPLPDTAYHNVKGFASAPGRRYTLPSGPRNPEAATAADDVGLVVLTKPVAGIAPVAIAGPGDAALELPGTSVRVLGYGISAPIRGSDFPASTPLQGGVLTLVGPPACATTQDICAQDLDGDATLTQPCAGDAGGPLLAQGPNGPVQIGVTSWGPGGEGNDCGLHAAPSVWMRVSRLRPFLTDPSPVLAPYTTGKVKLRGTSRLTCVAPAFRGSKAKLTYAWGVPRVSGQLVQGISHPMRPLKGATTRHYLRGGHAPREIPMLACAVTATNASGSWTVYSPSVVG